MRSLLTLLLITLLCTCARAQMKALVGGTLIDGFGGKPIRNSVVLIEGDRIKAVGTRAEVKVPADTEIISTEGMSVMPGMWDMHVHLMINGHSDYAYWDTVMPPFQEDIIMPASAKQLLMAGVTSARDLGGPGPTMYMSGPFLQFEPYPGTEDFRWGVKSVAEARAKVNKLADAGVDCIKVVDQDQMPMDAFMALVDQAHKRKLTVVAHSHRPEEIRRGLKAGVDCFEHTGLSSAPNYPEDVLEMIRERTAQMNLGPLYWTPTVEGLYNYEYTRDKPYFQLTPIRKPTLERKVKSLVDAGVVLMIGTDSGIPMKFHCQSTWNELDVWVNEFDLESIYTIKAATYWPAKMMGVDKDYGTVSAGKFADIIAVKGDVLRHIALLSDFRFSVVS